MAAKKRKKSNNPGGRPPRDGEAFADCNVRVRLADYEREKLEAFAQVQGTSMSAIVRRGLVRLGVLSEE